MAALSTAAATVFPIGFRFSVRYSCVRCGDKRPYATAFGLNVPNNDFDIVNACCYVTILNGSLRKFRCSCLFMSEYRTCQPSAHRPVRSAGHPSIFLSSAYLLPIPESCILLRYVNDVTFSVSCTEWQLQIVCFYQNALLRLKTGAFDIIAVTLGGSVTQTSVANSTPHPQIHCISGSVSI